MLQIRIHGRGGQGVVTAAEMLSIAAFEQGRHAQAFPSFGSERTGAPVVAFCRIDDHEIRLREPILAPDALIVQDPTLLHQVDVFRAFGPTATSSSTASAASTSSASARSRSASAANGSCTVPATEIALKHLGRPLPNAVLLGGFAALSGLITLDAVAHAIRDKFPARSPRPTSPPRPRPSQPSVDELEAPPMLKQIEGSRAVAEAVALCRPDVICAYPISPQTHIVEGLGEMVKSGDADAAASSSTSRASSPRCSVAIGASAAGARTYTATASQGLLFMAEAVYNASGLGLPIVMTIANRAIGAPINIWNDHSDSMSQRDSGWIQLFAETNQEALDLHIQAFRLAEELSMPVMVCMDGFILTHAYERVDIPTQAEVDAFLPPYEPRQVLDPADPVSIGAMVGPEAFMEVRYLAHAKQIAALELIPQIAAEFAARFGRESGGLVRGYRCEDAETIVVALGSVIGTIKDTVDELRDTGVRIGVLGIKSFRPFPLAAVRAALQGASASSSSRRASASASAASCRPMSAWRSRACSCTATRSSPAWAAAPITGIAAHALRARRSRRARAAHLPRSRLEASSTACSSARSNAPLRPHRREPAARRRRRRRDR